MTVISAEEEGDVKFYKKKYFFVGNFGWKKMEHKDMELKENGADNGDFKETALLKNESKYKETPPGCCR